MAARFLALLLIPFLLFSTSLSPSRAEDDLMDRYVSLPGSFSFVRRAPEETVAGKVVLTLFEDFICPHCYQVFTELIPALKKKYQKKLDIRFRGIPFVHASSNIPARAYAIAHEFGLHEEMQQALFHVRFEEDIDTTSRSGIAHVANSIGLDPELLLTRLDAGGGKNEVEQTIALGQRYHLDSVPSLIFDGWIRVNDLSVQNIETIIDGLLERKQATR